MKLLGKAIRASPTALPLCMVIAGAALGGVAKADSITDSMRKEDPRLNALVTLTEPRIRVGQLLEKLTKEHAIDVSADEHDGASDVLIVMVARKAPIAAVLDAIWSLLSHKRALFDWQRERHGDAYAYRLVRPLAARRFPEVMKSSVQLAFEAEALSMQKALQLQDKDIERLGKKDDRVADLLKSERKRGGLTAFFESTPEDVRTSVLRGERSCRIALSDLSPAARSFVLKVWKDYDGYKLLPDGTHEPIPEPGWIEFYARRGPLSVPSLFAGIEGIGAYNYLGGMPLQRSIRDLLCDLWMLPGDLKSIPTDHTKLSAEEPLTAQKVTISLLARRLIQLADSAKISVICRVPRKASTQDLGSPSMQTLQSYIDKLTADVPPFFLSKWRAGILTISHVDWFNEPPPSPWRLVKSVYALINGERSRFQLVDLVRIAGSLTREELTSLSEEFPVLRAVARWNDLFSLLSRSKSLMRSIQSDTGAPIEELAVALSAIPELSPLMARNEVQGARVRLYESNDLGGVVLLKIIAMDGKELGGLGFANRTTVNMN